MEIERFEIAKLELRPGDLLVAKINMRVTSEVIDQIRESIARCVPDGVKFVVLDETIDFSVIAVGAPR